jgi:hypothetical protein
MEFNTTILIFQIEDIKRNTGKPVEEKPPFRGYVF